MKITGNSAIALDDAASVLVRNQILILTGWQAESDPDAQPASNATISYCRHPPGTP